jgi:AcrR family transcriptional regulator
MSARTARAPAALSHERICTSALRLIDEHGLDGFSTRKLGEALGCEAMAIYWYYPNKEALLDAVCDRLMAGVAAAVVDDADDWLATLRGVAHAYRRIAVEHPRAFPLLTTRRFSTEHTYGFLERLFALARRHHIPDRTAARHYRVVSSYCSGFALNELATRRDPTGPRAAALRRRFPRVAAVTAWLEPEHADEIFDAGLDVLLAPLASRRRRASR